MAILPLYYLYITIYYLCITQILPLYYDYITLYYPILPIYYMYITILLVIYAYSLVHG